jgi:hypothetical protein
MALELEPLCTARIGLAPPILLPGTPSGTRIIVDVTGVEVEGPRITAHQKGTSGADWMVSGPDGTLGSADVRMTWETDDGALILVQYRGRLDLSQAPPVVYAAPLFETGDERYAWLARIQGVAKGTLSPDMSLLTYEMYELR